MTREKFQDFLQEYDPQMHREIKEEVFQEYETIKKRGGARAGSGRKPMKNTRVVFYSRLSIETAEIIKKYQADNNLKTLTETIETLINEGYKHKTRCSE